MGLVRHEVEQGVHFSTVAAMFSVSASSSTLPLQQLGGGSDREGILVLLTQVLGQPWLLGQAEEEAAGQ